MSGNSPLSLTPTIAVMGDGDGEGEGDGDADGDGDGDGECDGDGDGDGAIDGDGDGTTDDDACGRGAALYNVVYPPPPQPAATIATSASARPAYLVTVMISGCLTMRDPFDIQWYSASPIFRRVRRQGVTAHPLVTC